MSYMDWKDKTAEFRKIDVRGVAGNFLEGLKKQAVSLPVGYGIEVVQSFEPIPLYDVMDILGYERYTKKVGETEFHAFFYRTEQKGSMEDLPSSQTTP